MADTTMLGPTPSVGVADYKAIVNQDYHTMPWTNATGSNVSAGDIVVVNGLIGTPIGNIDNGKTGTLLFLTVINVRKKNETLTQGNAVYWDTAGDPYNSTAGSGAATATQAGNYFMGRVIETASSTAERVRVLLIPNTNGMSAFSATTLGNLLTGGTEQTIYQTSATQNYPIGTIRQLADGRKFRYAKAGASPITRGLMQQSGVADTKFLDITQTGHAQIAGATAITVLCTTGSGAAVNAFAGGRLLVTTGTNLGDIYQISSSALQATDTLLDLVLAEPLRNAIAATDKIAVMPSRWMGTVVVPTTTATAAAAGVPLVDVAANNYYWAQTFGPAPLIVDTGDTIVVGAKVGIPGTNAVAGAGGVATATGFAYPIYGTVLWIATAGEPALVFLELE